MGAVSLIALIAIFMLPGTFTGNMPTSFDHSAHYFQAWQLKENLFRHGPYFWSHLWFAGYPANYLYPFGVYLAILAVHLCTFGLLGFAGSYALTFGLGFFLHGYAVYYLGCRAFDRKIALLAAVLFMIDRGSPFLGGWFWIVQVGTWPVAIGVALGLIATARLGCLVEKGGRKNIALAGLFAGLALLTHPLEMIYFLILAPVMLLTLLTISERRPAREALRDLAIAGAIGCAIGALFIAPLLGTSDYGKPYGFRWGALPELASHLYRGQIFSGYATLSPAKITFAESAVANVTDANDGLIAYISVLAFLALPFLFRARKPLTFFVAAFAVTGLLAASSTLHDFIGLQNLASYKQVEFARFMMFVKPFLFLAAAAGAFAMWRGLAVPFRKDRRSIAGLVIIGAIAAILYLPALGVLLDRHLMQTVELAKSDRLAEDRAAIATWLNRKAAEDKRFFRVAAMGTSKDDHTLIALGTMTKVPLLHLGFTPTINFKYSLSEKEGMGSYPSDSAAILEATNVRYVILRNPSARTDFKLIESFGAFLLYEFKGWTPDIFKVMEGDGKITVSRIDDEDIELEAAPGAHGFLRLNVSYFSRWTATRDGKKVAMLPLSIDANPGTGFMTVALEPGKYHFHFGWRAAEYLGILAFLAGVGAVVYLWRKDQSVQGMPSA